MTKPDEQDAVSRLAQGAQPVPPPHAAELIGSGAPELSATASSAPGLSALHARTVALVVPAAEGERRLIGIAEFVMDADVGPALRVFIHDADELEFLIAEKTFKGQIHSGADQGCDFLIHLGVQRSAPESKTSAAARQQQA